MLYSDTSRAGRVFERYGGHVAIAYILRYKTPASFITIIDQEKLNNFVRTPFSIGRRKISESVLGLVLGRPAFTVESSAVSLSWLLAWESRLGRDP